jgi:hypothetical protein
LNASCNDASNALNVASVGTVFDAFWNHTHNDAPARLLASNARSRAARNAVNAAALLTSTLLPDNRVSCHRHESSVAYSPASMASTAAVVEAAAPAAECVPCDGSTAAVGIGCTVALAPIRRRESRFAVATAHDDNTHVKRDTRAHHVTHCAVPWRRVCAHATARAPAVRHPSARAAARQTPRSPPRAAAWPPRPRVRVAHASSLRLHGARGQMARCSTTHTPHRWTLARSRLLPLRNVDNTLRVQSYRPRRLTW